MNIAPKHPNLRPQQMALEPRFSDLHHTAAFAPAILCVMAMSAACAQPSLAVPKDVSIDRQLSAEWSPDTPFQKTDASVSVNATWAGPAQIVFNSDTDRCDKTDIPDAAARAFRDFKGNVHLFATHYVARAMVGPDLGDVRRDCHVVYRSSEDADASHFQDRSWLYSFHTEDGRRILSLLHTEFEAWNHPGKCSTPDAGWPTLANCWSNSITMAISSDGGSRFVVPASPGNLVASPPYPYVKDNTQGTAGYQQPTNIIKVGLFYYAMILDWPFKAQKFGPCLIRTADPFDPSSWRAWNGAHFTIRFVNPYLDRDFKPEEHVCAPVGVPAIFLPGSLSVNRVDGTFLIVEFSTGTQFGIPGLYLSASRDLITWSKPSLVASTEEMLREEPPGKWGFGYFALLDATASDRDFATVSNSPFVYYVRFDQIRGNLSRILMRRQIVMHQAP